jgi:hypothetical protein
MTMRKEMRNLVSSIFLILTLSLAASATVDFKTVPCRVVLDVLTLMTRAAATFVILMMIYGAIKYIYSADDPGGRKQGKNTIIHAIVAGIIIGMWDVIRVLLANTWFGAC